MRYQLFRALLSVTSVGADLCGVATSCMPSASACVILEPFKAPRMAAKAVFSALLHPEALCKDPFSACVNAE